jgi:hypothetical protein
MQNSYQQHDPIWRYTEILEYSERIWKTCYHLYIYIYIYILFSQGLFQTPPRRTDVTTITMRIQTPNFNFGKLKLQISKLENPFSFRLIDH